ncbi:MAG: TIM44-like domain-containing protein [Planctomycetes bacterium]|nr:TIM44-like domain-containing protein [Planctomycetota bacterium]
MTRWLAALALVLVLLAPDEALARVGGGEGFGGGGGSSGGGGGGDGEVFYVIFRLLIELCFYHPTIGLPLLALFVGYLIYRFKDEQTQKLTSRRHLEPRGAGPRLPWDELRARDEGFSRVILQDFLTHLFGRYQHLRGTGDAATLRPYLADAAWARLGGERERNERLGLTVEHVILGAIDFTALRVAPDGAAQLTVRFTYNCTHATRARREDLFGVEVWRLQRAARAKSPTPEAARALGCPSCGAPVDAAADGKCTYCDRVVTPGADAWAVQAVEVLVLKPRHQFNLRLRGGEEEGTELPDVVDPRFAAREAELRARDPAFAWPAFEAYARRVFLALQAAWTAGSWEQARPYETDHLYQGHRFMLEAYRARGLQNRHEAVQVRAVRPVRVETDRWYDAVTVRVHADGLDYTVDGRGQVVAGSRSRRRRFSEYWTFVRRAGQAAKAKDPTGWDGQGCPNCGGPLSINQAGTCAYCGSTVTSGEFTWVLAAIEQDECYRG